MRYIKIRAKNYNEALMKLKMDHGDDAIPISHKYVKEGGIFNSRFFANDVVELTAAIHERKSSKILSEKRNIDITIGDPAKEKKIFSASMDQAAPVLKAGRNVSMEKLNKTIDDVNDNLNYFKARLLDPEEQEPGKGRTAEAVHQPEPKKAAEGVAITRFEKEFSEIKETLAKLLCEKEKEHDADKVKTAASDENSMIKPYLDILKNNDFDQDECNLILNEVKNSMGRDDLKDKYKIEKTLKDLLKSRIVTTGPIKMGNKKKIIMFIGPTGVGKTTTMAKLGAIYSLREGHNVVFITIDNYRIAATEQLKKYAEIMRIPIHVVNDQKEFRDIISKEKAEIIMVDTSGRSHKNELKIAEIKSFADMVEYDFEKILCVSAGTKKSDLNEIFKAFDIMDFNSIVITKVDETGYIGNVIDMADKYHKPISYYSNGQEVPNDIVVADPEKIAEMIMGSTGVAGGR